MSNISSKRTGIRRRGFLRGAAGGASVLLGMPLLESMLNENGTAYADGSGLPCRFISWFWGNGVNLNTFEPAMSPRTTPEAAEPWTIDPAGPFADLTDVKDYINICTGLMNRCQNIITHHEGLTAFNGYTFEPGNGPGFSTNFAGPTIDQVIAATPAGAGFFIPSLQVGISKFDSPADSGTTAEVLSVSGTPGNLQPLSPMRNPRQVWRLLFGPPPAPEGVRTSILDFVRYDLLRVRPQLGVNDRARFDAHLEAIRQLEQRIELVGSCAPPGEPAEDNSEGNGDEQLTLVNQIMADLIGVAFACDLTRVASCMFLPVAGESFFGEVTVPPGLPNLTAHLWSHDQREGYDVHIRYIMNRFGDWLRSLQAASDPTGGTLLESTILYASSDCANGNHQIARQPILVAGGGRGYLQNPGVHYQAELPPANLHGGNGTAAGRNTSDVLLTCLQAFEPAATSIGDPGTPTESTTPVTEIRTV